MHATTVATTRAGLVLGDRLGVGVGKGWGDGWGERLVRGGLEGEMMNRRWPREGKGRGDIWRSIKKTTMGVELELEFGCNCRLQVGTVVRATYNQTAQASCDSVRFITSLNQIQNSKIQIYTPLSLSTLIWFAAFEIHQNSIVLYCTARVVMGRRTTSLSPAQFYELKMNYQVTNYERCINSTIELYERKNVFSATSLCKVGQYGEDWTRGWWMNAEEILH